MLLSFVHVVMFFVFGIVWIQPMVLSSFVLPNELSGDPGLHHKCKREEEVVVCVAAET